MSAARPAAALAAALALAVAAPDASAFCRSTVARPAVVGDCTMGSAFLGWRSVCTSYSLSTLGTGDPDLTNELVAPVIATSVGRWREAPCDADAMSVPYLEIRALPDSTQPTGYVRDGANANVISFNSVWPMDRIHSPDAIAITILTHDNVTGDALDGDMEFNTRNYQFTLEPMTQSERIDLESVMVHEFGHFQGLSHNSENPATIMYPSLFPGETRRNLNSDDVEGICSIYPPDEAPDRACNLVPNGGFAVNPQRGRVVGGCGAPATVAPGEARGAARVLGALAALGLAAALRLRRRR